MLTVTDRAAQHLRERLAQKAAGLPEAVRIEYTGQGYQLTLDDAKDGDQVFEQEGQSYLLVGPDVGEALSDATLDAQESPQGTNLTLSAADAP